MFAIPPEPGRFRGVGSGSRLADGLADPEIGLAYAPLLSLSQNRRSSAATLPQAVGHDLQLYCQAANALTAADRRGE